MTAYTPPGTDRLPAPLDELCDISSSEYHAGALADRLGHSRMLLMRGMTPAQVAYCDAHPQPERRSDALVLGSLFHDTMELYTPNRPVEFPPGYTLQQYDSYRTAEARQWRDETTAAGIDIISASDWDMVRGMVESVTATPVVQRLLSLPHVREGTLTAELDGLLVKIRPDLLALHIGNGLDQLICVDWKTSESASPDVWPRDAMRRGYHLQAWLYKEVLERTLGLPASFLFIVVEKTAPYQVCIYRAAEDFIDAGEDLYRTILLPCWTRYYAGDYTSDAYCNEEHPIIDLELPYAI